jgi:hypothetical protein
MDSLVNLCIKQLADQYVSLEEKEEEKKEEITQAIPCQLVHRFITTVTEIQMEYTNHYLYGWHSELNKDLDDYSRETIDDYQNEVESVATDIDNFAADPLKAIRTQKRYIEELESDPKRLKTIHYLNPCT